MPWTWSPCAVLFSQAVVVVCWGSELYDKADLEGQARSDSAAVKALGITCQEANTEVECEAFAGVVAPKPACSCGL